MIKTFKTHLHHYNDRVRPFVLAPSQVPQVTRREQFGTDEATLEAKGGNRKRKVQEGTQPRQSKKPKAPMKSPKKRPSTSSRTKTSKTSKTPEKTMPSPKASARSKTAKAKAAVKAKASSKSKPGKKTKEDGESKETRTWAGRWIPTEEGVPLLKFQAIRQVFNENIAARVKAQSSLQSPYFKICQQAFSSLNANDASYADYVACAKRQVEKFLSQENVRNWATYDVL